MSKYRKECWTDADVRCPFYISDERSARSITCESVQKDDTARGISRGYADKARCVLLRGQAQHRGIRRAVRYA